MVQTLTATAGLTKYEPKTGIGTNEGNENHVLRIRPVESARRFYNITSQVRDAVTKSGVTDGVAIVFCPHTTAGITVNENADPDVVYDLLIGLNKAFLDRPEFCHGEGNSAAAEQKATPNAPERTTSVLRRRLLRCLIRRKPDVFTFIGKTDFYIPQLASLKDKRQVRRSLIEILPLFTFTILNIIFLIRI
jgi:thiamine phosphate synthase YjbQ (UPF0047 family)